MKAALLVLSLSLPLTASAQKLVATSPPHTYQVGTEKAPLYRAAEDTTGKPRFTVPAGWDISVVGEYSPRWLLIEREGYIYITPRAAIKIAPPVRTQLVPRTEEYCMILATAKLLSNKVTISVDFGQERRLFADNRYKDAEGKVQSFNSVIDVLNYQNGQGWEFVNAYVITVANQNVYHYVMKRRIKDQ